MGKEFQFLRVVRYNLLYTWDVKRYISDNGKHFSNAVRLRDILTPHFECISKEDLLKNKWCIIQKINFSGKLFLRDYTEAKTFKGNLNKVSENTLIYSKINVRHGCIYYHPSGSIPFATSTEYPAYKFDIQSINGDYLVKIIQSNYFKSVLNQKSTGISKSRVKSDEFLDVEIPLPSLVEQERLMNDYNDKNLQANNMERQAVKLEDDIEKYLFTELGIEQNVNSNQQNNSGYNFLKFVRCKEMEKWGVNYNSSSNTVSNLYPSKKIYELCRLGSGGTPSRSIPHYYKGDIPWIKTGEVINDEIIETEEHITQDAIDNSSAKIYPKGSLIIAMYGQGDTRGRTAKMSINAATNQACAVLFDIKNNIVKTDYLWYYLQGRYHDLRSLASGNNQPNLNAGKINNYDVIIPPIDVQNTIVDNINTLKSQIKQLRSQAEELRKSALEDFEREIFE